jgi:hypothetical protein
MVDNSAGFSAAFGAGNFNNTFVDKYTFSITDPSDVVDALVGSIARSSLVGLEINGFDLYASDNTLLGSGAMQQSGTVDLWTISTGATLPMGGYYIAVSGRMVSDMSASYGGNLSLAPIPEPATCAMLAAGLGVVGLALRRRKQA